MRASPGRRRAPASGSRPRGARRAPSGALEGKAGAEVPPSVFFDKDGLKPRWVAVRAISFVPAATRPRKRGSGRQGDGPVACARVACHGSCARSRIGGIFVPTRRRTSVSASELLGIERESAEPSLEELMEQAKNYVCRSCSTPVPLSHKFCGRCGAAIPPEILNARTQFFGQLQVPGKAKLILIRGEGVEGLSYQLNAEQHIVGRNGQLVFPDDPYVSPRHANLFYRNGKLVVRDEGSLNGVFWRVRGSVEVSPGDHFLAGEQLFRIEGSPRPNDGPAPDGTYFYTSPKHQTQFKHLPDSRGRRVGHGGLRARARRSKSAAKARDLNFAGGPLHERVALQARGQRAARSR